MAQATPTIQRAWGTKVAPSTRMGRSPVKAGSPAAFLPSVTMTPPLIRIEAPMVTMMRFSTSPCAMGRMISRSIRMPTAVTAAMVSDDDQRQGQARRREDRRAEHAAEHGELALGEVHRARRVEDDIEPERDEAVDRAHHEAREEELEQVRGVHVRLFTRTRREWLRRPGSRTTLRRESRSGAWTMLTYLGLASALVNSGRPPAPRTGHAAPGVIC